jgi:membrane-associated phospholipid phosphatase
MMNASLKYTFCACLLAAAASATAGQETAPDPVPPLVAVNDALIVTDDGLAAPASASGGWAGFERRLAQSREGLPGSAQWVRGGGMAAGAILAAALLDKPADRYFKEHQQSTAVRNWSRLGKGGPVLLAGMAGAAAVFGDERLHNTGVIALQSIAVSVGVSYGGKYLVGRARPQEERGSWAQVGPGSSRGDASFPSGHSAIAFAAVTPFAMEYDAPWLYGVASVAAMGRVAGRQHWVSDVVAGSVLGYAVGNWLWHSQRKQAGKSSQLVIVPGLKSVSFSYQKAY